MNNDVDISGNKSPREPSYKNKKSNISNIHSFTYIYTDRLTLILYANLSFCVLQKICSFP